MSPPTAVHQILAGFHPADGISRIALQIRAAARNRGLPAEIFTDPVHLEATARREIRSVTRIGEHDAPDATWILHLGAGSPVNDAFRNVRGRRILFYQNITPPRFFRPVNGTIADVLTEGRRQLRGLVPHVDRFLALSGYSAGELRELGAGEVAVVPAAPDVERLHVPPNPHILELFDDDMFNILFVGRGAPNKRLDLLIRVFAEYHARFDRHSRLLMVGSFGGTEQYYHWLRLLARALGTPNVFLEGARSEAELAAYFKAANLFLCLSDHEGFGLPLIEAMHFGLPVVAAATTAVPETLGGAGVLVHDTDPTMVAAVIDAIHRSPALRDGIVARQHRRAAGLRRDDFVTNLCEAVGIPAEPGTERRADS